MARVVSRGQAGRGAISVTDREKLRAQVTEEGQPAESVRRHETTNVISRSRLDTPS